MATEKNLTIYRGKTFSQVVRWETQPFIYKAISAVPSLAPVRLTVTSHGIPSGWRVMPESVKGMTQLNDVGWQKATVIDTNTIELNEVNASNFKTYLSGGVLKLYTPQDMTGYTARMTIKNKVGGTAIATLTSVNGKITLDNTGKTITLTIPATETELITGKSGVYDLELVSGTGVVTGLLAGKVTFEDEVTT